MGIAMTSTPFVSGHGGQIDVMAKAFPGAPLPWLDLSTGINPFPYPTAQIPEGAWTRLPTAADRETCEAAMASAFGCDAVNCRAVSGTELAIRQLPAILQARRVVLRDRSYGDHEDSWKAAEADVEAVHDPLDHVEKSDAVVIVNPNNPDGLQRPIDQIENARRNLARRGGWMIVDEAYADLDPGKSVACMAGQRGLIVLRSFGKFFGLAGVRLGSVLGPSEILSDLGAKLGGWDVSGPALALGAAAYSDIAWQRATRTKLKTTSEAFSQVLARTGIEEVGGTDLFRFVRVPDAAATWEKLATKGIAVRRFAQDDQHLRIGLPRPGAFERLADALSP